MIEVGREREKVKTLLLFTFSISEILLIGDFLNQRPHLKDLIHLFKNVIDLLYSHFLDFLVRTGGLPICHLR